MTLTKIEVQTMELVGSAAKVVRETLPALAASAADTSEAMPTLVALLERIAVALEQISTQVYRLNQTIDEAQNNVAGTIARYRA